MSNPLYARDIETGLMKELDAVEVEPGLWALRTVDASYEPLGGKTLVGTAREKFYADFSTFDTSETGPWELVQTGPGMTLTAAQGGAVAGASPYLNIASGVTAGSTTIILSRSFFKSPVEARFQITASQRIANNSLRIGFVQVDDAGAIVTTPNFLAAPGLLNAANCAFAEMSGTTATTGSVITRAGGSAPFTLAAAYGTGFTTVATGTGPNFISATTYNIMLERDRVSSRAFPFNSLTNLGGQFVVDQILPNPEVHYKLAIIIENGATAPATTTDWRLHLVNILDATRFDVSPRNPGTTDGSRSFPMWLNGGTLGTLTTLSALTTITTTGTPAAPATPYFVNSAATTNGALILTGTSGLQAFFATNSGATVAYVKLYNKATAPTVGTDVPEMIIPVPAANAGVPGVTSVPTGFNAFRFALGLGIAITGGAADSDTTAVAAGQVRVKLSRTA